jgi:hypothetical protein
VWTLRIVGLLLERAATRQARTTGSVYNSITRQTVRRISRGGVFVAFGHAEFTAAPGFDSSPCPARSYRAIRDKYFIRKKDLRMKSNWR